MSAGAGSSSTQPRHNQTSASPVAYPTYLDHDTIKKETEKRDALVPGADYRGSKDEHGEYVRKGAKGTPGQKWLTAVTKWQCRACGDMNSAVSYRLGQRRRCRNKIDTTVVPYYGKRFKFIEGEQARCGRVIDGDCTGICWKEERKPEGADTLDDTPDEVDAVQDGPDPLRGHIDDCQCLLTQNPDATPEEIRPRHRWQHHSLPHEHKGDFDWKYFGIMVPPFIWDQEGTDFFTHSGFVSSVTTKFRSRYWKGDFQGKVKFCEGSTQFYHLRTGDAPDAIEWSPLGQRVFYSTVDNGAALYGVGIYDNKSGLPIPDDGLNLQLLQLTDQFRKIAAVDWGQFDDNQSPEHKWEQATIEVVNQLAEATRDHFRDLKPTLDEHDSCPAAYKNYLSEVGELFTLLLGTDGDGYRGLIKQFLSEQLRMCRSCGHMNQWYEYIMADEKRSDDSTVWMCRGRLDWSKYRGERPFLQEDERCRRSLDGPCFGYYMGSADNLLQLQKSSCELVDCDCSTIQGALPGDTVLPHNWRSSHKELEDISKEMDVDVKD